MKNFQPKIISFNFQKRFALLTIFLSFLLFFGSFPSVAAPGDLDTTFGGGSVTTSVCGNSSANGVAVQSDGKIVAAGCTGTSFGVVRLNTNGTLDNTFGTNGVVNTSFSNTAWANEVVIQTDSKIIVVGWSIENSFGGFTLVRYNTNGTLDTGFGVGGKVFTKFAATSDDRAWDAVLQPDGKIIAAGRSSDVGGFAVARYNTDGSLDTSFGNGGKAATSFQNTGGDFAQSVALTLDGKIVLAGYVVSTATNDDFALARFNSNGTIDTTFGTNGKVVTAMATGNNVDAARDVAVQRDSKIVAAGFVNNTGNFAVARYNVNGSLDTSFGTTGKIITPVSNSFDEAYAVIIQPNDKILLAGYSYPSISSPANFALVRYAPNGSLDNTFGTNGIVTTPFGSAGSEARAATLQSDGRIVAVGLTFGTSGGFTVARYLNETFVLRRAPFDYDGDNKTDISIFRPAPGEWWYQKSSNGGNFAAQFGASTDKIVPADYTGDGKTDFGFFRPSSGFWFVLRSEDFSFFAFPFGVGTDIPVPADYDGDGKADAAVFRPSTLTWFIQKSSGGTDIIGFGAAGDKPVVGDYDGDGKADIAIFRPNGANGAEWWIRRSSNGSVFALQFGTSTDKPTQGDFTSDGKTDIALWRPSNGNWFVLRSEDFSFFAFPFGANGDVPVAGDYDGDGKFDAGVFRPSSNTWFIQRSTAGTLIQQFGIAGDLPTPNVFVP